MKLDVNSLLRFLHNSVNVGNPVDFMMVGARSHWPSLSLKSYTSATKCTAFKLCILCNHLFWFGLKYLQCVFFSSFLIQAFFPMAKKIFNMQHQKKRIFSHNCWSIWVGIFHRVFLFQFSGWQFDNKKSILKKGTEKVHPCILGQAFSVCFLLIFILWKWQNFCWQNMSLHWKNTFLQHEVYLGSIVYKNKFAFNLCDLLQVIINPNKI
jgi:hypothetical protein